MAKRSPSRPNAVYRMTFSVTLGERRIIEAIARLQDKGVGETIFTWVRPQLEYYAEDPLVKDFIASLETRKEAAPKSLELSRDEALSVIEGERGPEWFERRHGEK